MVILVDMDDVIENLSVTWIDFLNMKYGTNVDRETVRDWDMSKAFPELTPEQVYSPLCDPELWRLVPPKDDAAKYMAKLINDGNEIYIVTNTDYRSVLVKMEEILFKYFPFIDWGHVIITSNKQMIRGDVLVDDGVHNLVNGEYEKILFDTPYNREFNAEAHGMIRVSSWEEVYNVLTSLSARQTCVGVRESNGFERNDIFGGDRK